MAEAIYENDNPVSCGPFEVLRVSVTEADNEEFVYRGDATIKDHIEHGIEFTHGWVAEPGPFVQTIMERIYEMDIKPTEPFWGPDIFTLAAPLDRAMRHQIMHAILAVNPSLPCRLSGTALN